MKNYLKRALAAVTLGLVLVTAGVAAAASAHGGAIQLVISQDGLGGVIVGATYQEDGHPVEAIMDPVLVAESADGEKVGPISLISSGEGVGTWVTAEPVLTAGSWTVTVTTTQPIDAGVTSQLDVVLVEEPSETLDDGVADPVPAPDVAGIPIPLIVALAIALLVLLALIIVLLLRLRSARAAEAQR